MTKQINGGFAPMNDAQYFGSVVFAMYQDWYGMRPISQKLKMWVHYGNEFENAGWDGSEMKYGDGRTTFYPLVSLDVTAHEVSHGFTEQHSGLIYQYQSGGINEAFSDMAGIAAVYFQTGAPTSVDYRIAESLFKAPNQALRYMCNPPQDGASIDSAKNYTDSLDVHYTSGVFNNKAFCLLSKKPGWDIRKAFEIFLNANRDYWTPSATFVSAATGVIDAALDRGYSTADVADAFAAVDIQVLNPPGQTEPGGPSPTTGEAGCFARDAQGNTQAIPCPPGLQAQLFGLHAQLSASFGSGQTDWYCGT
jgi:Zn-dependent metalloprotease